jgi:hypothetical protein
VGSIPTASTSARTFIPVPVTLAGNSGIQILGSLRNRKSKIVNEFPVLASPDRGWNTVFLTRTLAASYTYSDLLSGKQLRGESVCSVVFFRLAGMAL